jgi:hypothetical protein
MDPKQIRDALTRIQADYLEMPGLKLTLHQGRRLWSMPLDLCEVALSLLVREGVLNQTPEGAFFLRTMPQLRVGATATDASLR